MEWVRQMSNFHSGFQRKKGVAKTVYTWRVAICLEHFWGILAVYVNVMVKNGEKSISLVTLKFSEITTQRTNK